MAEILFIKPEEITKTSILGGNVDIDKYLFCINSAQITVLEPLLGSELYNKIVNDIENNNLTGVYLDLFDSYIKPITKNESLAQYIEISSYTLNNGGLFKHAPENVEIVDKDEAQFLAGKYHNLADMHIKRFEKFICKNKIKEYKTIQDEVNAQKDITLKAGWLL